MELNEYTQQLAAELERRLGSGAEAEICLSATKYLLTTPAERLEMLSYGSLYAAMGQKHGRIEFIRAMQILSGSWLNLLDIFFKFYDKNSNEEYDVDNDEVLAAQKDGRLVHPKTGDLVEDYEEDLLIYFCASEKLKDMKKKVHAR
ncbi:hypothetical protein [Azospirillum sp. SYSU D00513]|uniref:hypothetical protein n=1 Tax=Azospirillum sp. SYSU D00513 TaxID=2812561 RepID=UPI001A97B384|nr:hypothetical protein [Azospirillum sp. SYSU D00513]